MTLNLILARAANGVIGRNGTLPWHLPEDLAHFKRLTMGCAVIMGRKTWDSLPAKFRPLPGRLNLVLTRQQNWQGTGALRADSLQQALALAPPAGAVWVIGGAEIYAAALPLADQAVVTEIGQAFEGDAFAPQFGGEWLATTGEPRTSVSGLPYRFVTYQRNAAKEN